MGHDAGFRGQRKRPEEHDEREQMYRTSLYSYPFVVGYQPRQRRIQPPPSREKEIRPGVLDDSFGIDRRPRLAVEYLCPIQMERGEDRPVDVGEKRQIGECPEC